MSFTDDQADPVQPEGQGEGGQAGDSPYSEYLDRIQDEEARGVAEEAFKAFDANTTKKFQEHASYRKSWEPFEQLGVSQQDPQSVAWALQVAELAQSDPRAFHEWVNGDWAAQHGLQQQQEPGGFGEEFATDPQQQLEQLLEQRLSPIQQMLDQYGSRFEQQEQQQAQHNAQQFVEKQISELEEKHGAEFDREAVELFLPHFTETAKSREDLEQAVPRAFEALQALRSKHEKAALQPKVDAPKPAEGGGVPDVTPEKLKTIADSKIEAARLLQQWNRQ